MKEQSQSEGRALQFGPPLPKDKKSKSTEMVDLSSPKKATVVMGDDPKAIVPASKILSSPDALVDFDVLSSVVSVTKVLIFVLGMNFPDLLFSCIVAERIS